MELIHGRHEGEHIDHAAGSVRRVTADGDRLAGLQIGDGDANVDTAGLQSVGVDLGLEDVAQDQQLFSRRVLGSRAVGVRDDRTGLVASRLRLFGLRRRGERG